MQGFTFAAITDAEKIKLDVGWTEIWTPISHPAVSRCDQKHMLEMFQVFTFLLFK